MAVFVLIGLALKAKGRPDRPVSPAVGGGSNVVASTVTTTV
ncbi:hypothetical protein [Blastococcus sp. CT_GayMR16]|nr:hypothetical protein [Blastococcus sp. CT_GayMR16]